MTNRAYDDGVEEKDMLIIEHNSVYEIDEECIRRKGAPKECHTMEKLQKRREQMRADPMTDAGLFRPSSR